MAKVFSASGASSWQEVAYGKFNVQSACVLNTMHVHKCILLLLVKQVDMGF
jgi:hypothetical protein